MKRLFIGKVAGLHANVSQASLRRFSPLGGGGAHIVAHILSRLAQPFLGLIDAPWDNLQPAAYRSHCIAKGVAHALSGVAQIAPGLVLRLPKLGGCAVGTATRLLATGSGIGIESRNVTRASQRIWHKDLYFSAVCARE
jgi:hypothetical protein